MIGNNFIRHSLNSVEEIVTWKKLLSNYSLESIHQQFENYKTCCHLDCVGFNRIKSSVESLFSINYMGHDFSPNFRYTIIPQDRPADFPYYFFRIRKLTRGCWLDINSDSIEFNTIEFEEIQTLKDIWERPAEQIGNYQRLNEPYNSVLYTSLMPSTAILETNLKEEDLFFLITYKSIGKFKYSDCCRFVYFNDLSEEENMKRYIMFYLLRDEFTRILPGSYKEGNQYCSAYEISKKFFIEGNVQGIQYPSTRGLGHKNFAFWGNIRDYLEFIGFRLCALVKKEGTQSDIRIIADGFWDEKSRKFKYFSPFSDKSKQIFGDILLDAMMRK